MTPSPRASNAAPMSAVTVTAQRKFPKSETYLEISHVNTKTCILDDHPPHRRRSSAAKQGASRSSYPTFSSPWSFVWAWTSAGASGARWPTMGEEQRWATPRLDRQPNLSHHQDFRGQRSCPQCTSGWRLMTLFKRRHLKRVNYRPETRGNISEMLCCL